MVLGGFTVFQIGTQVFPKFTATKAVDGLQSLILKTLKIYTVYLAVT